MNTYVISLKVDTTSDESATKFAQFVIDTINVYKKDGGEVKDVGIALTKLEAPAVGE
jgi:hypothetical protein